MIQPADAGIGTALLQYGAIGALLLYWVGVDIWERRRKATNDKEERARRSAEEKVAEERRKAEREELLAIIGAAAVREERCIAVQEKLTASNLAVATTLAKVQALVETKL